MRVDVAFTKKKRHFFRVIVCYGLYTLLYLGTLRTNYTRLAMFAWCGWWRCDCGGGGGAMLRGTPPFRANDARNQKGGFSLAREENRRDALRCAVLVTRRLNLPPGAAVAIASFRALSSRMHPSDRFDARRLRPRGISISKCDCHNNDSITIKKIIIMLLLRQCESERSCAVINVNWKTRERQLCAIRLARNKTLTRVKLNDCIRRSRFIPN